MSRSRRACAVLGVVAPLLVVGPRAGAAPCVPLQLPRPSGEIPIVTYPGLPPERSRKTFVPGPVTDDERVSVLLGPDGTPQSVRVQQRLELSGTGDYAVRVRGPALRATPLDDTVAPVIIRGAVVWQGFSPGSRRLAAELELDPRREALVLPLVVELEWDGAPMQPGGRLPSAGRLTVRLVNQTVQPIELPTGTASDASSLAAALDVLLAYARDPAARQAPDVTRDLPALGATACTTGRILTDVAAQLRVAGSVQVAGVGGVRISGPGARPLPAGDGAAVEGVLALRPAEIALDVPAAGGTLVVDLTVRTTLDPRLLRPPGGHATWAAWAATRPDAAARDAALDTLVAAAAALARNDDKAPYLGHHGPGPTSTVFRYSIAPAPVVKPPEAPLRPRPVPIALTGLGLALLATGGVAVWRRL